MPSPKQHETTPLLPPPSAATPLLPPPSAPLIQHDMSSKVIETLRLPLCIIVPYLSSSFIVALPLTVVCLFLQLLEPLIPDTDLLFFEWTSSDILISIWFLLFLLGINVEVLKYAGWLLMGVLKKREDSGDKKYKILAIRISSAVHTALCWTIDKYLDFFDPDWEIRTGGKAGVDCLG